MSQEQIQDPHQEAIHQLHMAQTHLKMLDRVSMGTWDLGRAQEAIERALEILEGDHDQLINDTNTSL